MSQEITLAVRQCQHLLTRQPQGRQAGNIQNSLPHCFFIRSAASLDTSAMRVTDPKFHGPALSERMSVLTKTSRNLQMAIPNRSGCPSWLEVG